jgi:HSP20 family protein
MNLQQLNPWNWFKHEETSGLSTIPVKRAANEPESKQLTDKDQFPVFQLHREIDRLFDQALRGFGVPSLYSNWLDKSLFNSVGFQAKVNVSSDDKNYHVSLEAPGLTEKEISLELDQGVLSIRGEKKEESETKDRHYYRVERSYGSFQRVLTLPEDCDQEAISATMKNGVLDITLPRKALPASAAKQIPIN